MQRIRDDLRRALVPALALVTAFVLGGILIALTDVDHLRNLGTDPMGSLGSAFGGVIDGYGAMVSGAIGDPGRIVAALRTGNTADIEAAIRPLSETLVIATPFIFVCLGLALSFQAGLINLGADGQFLMGSLGAALTATYLAGHLPPWLVLIVALAGGTLGGAAYGFIPGFLKARTGAHEVITTLMLNGVAPSAAFLIGQSIDLSGPPPAIPSVPRLVGLATIRVDWGFVAALVMAVVVSRLLFRTTRGFELRATGFSRTVARGAGMRPGRATILAMALSGGLVGMGSAFFGLGPAQGFSGPPSFDMGYVALALTMLGGRRPAGVVVAALLYGALITGAKNMVIVTGVPLALLGAIIAFAILFVAAPDLIRSIWRLKPPEPATEVT